VIGIDKDISSASLNDVPPLFIFPDTDWASRGYNKPADWGNYIRFYTEEKKHPH
jgi:hypothetical protein